MDEVLSSVDSYRNIEITVLYGGVSDERSVALSSGRALATALRRYFRVVTIDLTEAEVPSDLRGESTVVFPALHGAFGEDGQLQALLEARGIVYAGSDSLASRLCMDKPAAKERVAAAGVRVAQGVEFEVKRGTDVASVTQFGERFVVKPAEGGSSLGLHQGLCPKRLESLLPVLPKGRWMVETHIRGREITVGVLEGQALGLVEVIPYWDGVYDFEHKYIQGLTDYRFPAVVSSRIEAEIKWSAERAFAVCGCRDFARVDFILSEAGECYFLEINTLPGLTETSLMPRSAACQGWDFTALCVRLMWPALQRFQQTIHGSCVPQKDTSNAG